MKLNPQTTCNSLFMLIRDHLATGDKSADMPLVALSQIEEKLLCAEDDVKRLHKEKCDLLDKYVWHPEKAKENYRV